MNDVTKRFIDTYRAMGLTGYKMGKDCPVITKQKISNIENGKTEASMEVLSAFFSCYDEVNPDYIMKGKGRMLKDSDSSIEVVPSAEKIEGEYFTENNNGVKFYDLGNGKYRMVVKKVPFSAYGRFANEADTLEPDKEDWEEESFEFGQVVHGKYLSFDVKGDSMDDGSRNSFEEGDVLLVRELGRQHWRDKFRLKDHPYWVVVFDSSVLLKQMVAQDIETGDLTFHSLNPSPEYADFTLNVDRIRALFYVLQKKPKTIMY